MAQNIPLETYISLENEFGKAVAEKVTKLLDFSFNQAEKRVDEIALQKKLEVKDELSKELASKSDLALVKTELQVDIKLVKSDLRFEIRTYFLVLLCAIIILNRDSILLIAQLLGAVK